MRSYHLLGGSYDNMDVFPKREPKVFGCAHIQRIHQRYAQRVIDYGDRQSAVKSCQTARDQPQDLRRNFLVRKIKEIGAECVGDDLIKAALIDKAAVDQGLLDAFAVQVRLLQNVISL